MRDLPPSDSYRRKFSILLIHDDLLDNFNPAHFNSRFDVHQMKVNSLAELENKRTLLDKMTKRLKPDCIYVHLGAKDFLTRKSGIANAVHRLANHLIDSTRAKVCFSLLPPSSRNNTINERIDLINNEIHDLVSWKRQTEDICRDRLFTFSNDPIRHHNTYTPGKGFSLNKKGEKAIWLRLRDGMRKAMRLPRPNLNGQNSRNPNRFNDG